MNWKHETVEWNSDWIWTDGATVRARLNFHDGKYWWTAGKSSGSHKRFDEAIRAAEMAARP